MAPSASVTTVSHKESGSVRGRLICSCPSTLDPGKSLRAFGYHLRSSDAAVTTNTKTLKFRKLQCLAHFIQPFKHHRPSLPAMTHNIELQGRSFALLFFVLFALTVTVATRPTGVSDGRSFEKSLRHGSGGSSSSNPSFDWHKEVSYWTEPSPGAAPQDVESSPSHWHAQHPVINIDTSPSPSPPSIPARERNAAPPDQEERTHALTTSQAAPQDRPAPNEDAINFYQQSLDEWQVNMRRALGNPYLEFISIHTPKTFASQIFLAQHPTDLADHHSVTGTIQPLPATPGRLWYSHFVNRLHYTRSISGKGLPFGSPYDRHFVYLNSEHNMHYLNHEYFLNNLQFFPINPHKLTRRMLSDMMPYRKLFWVLPPRTEPHGLPLLLMKHAEDTKWMRSFKEVTGDFRDERQVVSLWSPLLVSRGMPTMVLYGVGQLNPENGQRTVLHLEQMAKEWEGKPLAAAYYLKDHFPDGWPYHVA